MMNRTLRIAFMFVGITIALPALGGETTPVKCPAGQDRVWVYDSLSSLGVQTKVKCGDRVEIVAREKGFVKVRTQDGTEGYVPEDALPKPVPAPANDSNNSEKPAADNSLAAQARAYRAARAAASASVAENAAPAPVAAIPKIEKASEARASTAQPQAQIGSVQPAIVSSISIEPLNAATKTAAAVKNNESADGNKVAASPQPAVNAPGVNVVASSEAGSAPAPVPASQKNDKAAVAAAKKPKTAPAPPVSKPVRPAPAATSTSTTSSASNTAPAAPASARSIAVASNATSEAPRAVAAVETNLSVSGKSPATLQPVPNASTHTVAATSSDTDSEDYPERLIEDESASAACQVYFSAYGLSPNQYKWIAENRRKKYPGICPAPGPAKVDFVVIFTHDVEFYNSTMPAAVHTDKNGFSDFTPLTTADTALLSASELDKSHHEYVWVFQMKRGTFDPAKFSPRRRPQFTKTESNGLGSHGGGPRTVEDAFRFIEEGAPAR
jgi:hypothetical protein